MPYDKQLEDKFRFFNARIIELEKAAEAQDRAIKQLAEEMGVEIDLTPVQEETHAQDHLKSAGDLMHDKDILALLEESQRDDSEE